MKSPKRSQDGDWLIFRQGSGFFKKTYSAKNVPVPLVFHRKRCSLRGRLLKSQTAFLFVSIVAIACTAALGEVPLRSKAELESDATHIVSGKVQALYSSTSRSENWLTTDFVAEIAVQKVEKGEKLQAGDEVYARFWNKTWIGKGVTPPHSAGHTGPAKDAVVRAYLVEKNGGYDAILPNGFEQLQPPPKSQQPQQHSAAALAALQGTWNFVHYEETNYDVHAGDRQFVIADDRLDFRDGGKSRLQTRLQIDASQSPPHFTQNFDDGQVYRSIYTLHDDYLIVCGIRDGARPIRFTRNGDGRGEFLIVLKRQ